jgi:hypothetical protein
MLKYICHQCYDLWEHFHVRKFLENLKIIHILIKILIDIILW